MSIAINYKNTSDEKNSSNIVLFVDEKFNISGLKKYILSSEFSFISDLLKTKDLKKKIINFDINSKKKIILVSLKKNLTCSDAENLGAKFYDEFKDIKQSQYFLNSDTAKGQLTNCVGYFLHGLKLKSYLFEKYKSKKNKKNISITVTGKLKP
jgi:leucyl aminopeptidase